MNLPKIDVSTRISRERGHLAGAPGINYYIYVSFLSLKLQHRIIDPISRFLLLLFKTLIQKHFKKMAQLSSFWPLFCFFLFLDKFIWINTKEV